MFIVIAFMLAGLVLGFLFHTFRFRFINSAIITLIWLLLFLLGLEVGANTAIISKISSLGLVALFIAAMSTLGSVIGARFLLAPDKINADPDFDEKLARPTFISTLRGLKGSLIILSFFVLGIFVGSLYRLPDGIDANQWSFYALAALMFSVGFGMGQSPENFQLFRRIKAKILLLPFTTIIGTWAGALLACFFVDYTISDLLAISSGLGYYSLSSVIISDYSGAELGTLALLSNIAREIYTLILAPFMVRYFGKLSPIAAGGATTMDTTFPIIIQVSGKEYSIVSIYHGFVLDFSVPFLVSFWVMM